ncbi:MAG: phytanoyl-CoA dioxygenase family protein, partial [Verrucomicrobiota bacterium]
MKKPALDEAYTLPSETVAAFGENGHAFVPNLASAEEIAFYREAINEAADRYGQSPDTPLESRDTYGKAFLQHMNLWEFDETVAAFTLGPRFGQVAAELMGTPGVRLYHDQALFKEPGGGFTPWHQDQYYWPIDTDRTITMWMPLVDISEEMGM